VGLTRRHFLQSSAVALAALRSDLHATSPRMMVGFSTLGCPSWEWAKILDFAKAHDFSAFELRGLLGTMDLPTRPEFQPDRIAQSKRDVASRNLKIACVSSSAELHHADPEKRQQQIADAKRFIDLAASLGAPNVRVFGNKIEGPREQVLARVASGLSELGTYSAGRGVTVLIESHGDFTDSPTLNETLTRADSPGVGLLWDAHHTFVSGREDPQFTVEKLGRYIRHTHLKDSVPAGEGRRYVLTGRGEVPVRKQIEVLAATGYTGCYTFEWEKVWHPDLEEPEIAFADFAEFMRKLPVGAAGARMAR
jgi:sugar phosphate isomerase/epimerase